MPFVAPRTLPLVMIVPPTQVHTTQFKLVEDLVFKVSNTSNHMRQEAWETLLLGLFRMIYDSLWWIWLGTTCSFISPLAGYRYTTDTFVLYPPDRTDRSL